LLLLSLVAVGLSACTNRDIYENIRTDQRQDCNRQPSDSERQRCLARTQDSYEEYTRKRKTVTAGEQQ
jgi:hypothetical protein